jgi:hypothetical protein
MELDYKTTLPEDFSNLCDIFKVRPERFIQVIIDKVSFPYFFSHPNETGRWATLIFLELLDSEDLYDEREMEFNEPYLTDISEKVQQILEEGNNEQNQANAEQAVRQIIRRWHKDLLKERVRYLIDDLPPEE